MILVTGGTGFIGRHLVEALLKRERHVALLVHRAPPLKQWVRSKQIRIFKIDITRPKDFSRIPKSVHIEGIFHLATHIPKSDTLSELQQCIAVNLMATQNLLEWAKAREIRKVISSSTISVYQIKASELVRLREGDPVLPFTYYGISKLAGELFCEKYRKAGAGKAVLLRYSSVYGVGQKPATVLPLFIRKAIGGEEIKIFGKGVKVQDFVYVKDVVDANLLAFDRDVEGIYNVGSGTGTSVIELAKRIVEIFGGSASKISFDASMSEDTSQVVLDITKAKRDFGYQPKYDLRRGLREYSNRLGTAGVAE